MVQIKIPAGQRHRRETRSLVWSVMESATDVILQIVKRNPYPYAFLANMVTVGLQVMV